MKILLAIFGLFLVSTSVFADCIEYDISAWKQEEINLIEAATYNMAWIADNRMQPPTINVDYRTKIATVCFNETHINLGTVIKDSLALAKAKQIIKDGEELAIALEIKLKEDSKKAIQKLKDLGLTNDEITALGLKKF